MVEKNYLSALSVIKNSEIKSNANSILKHIWKDFHTLVTFVANGTRQGRFSQFIKLDTQRVQRMKIINTKTIIDGYLIHSNKHSNL